MDILKVKQFIKVVDWKVVKLTVSSLILFIFLFYLNQFRPSGFQS